MPEHCYGPEEEAAASVLQRDGWGADIRLLQVSNPQRLLAMIEVMRLASNSVDVFAECRTHLALAPSTRDCMIKAYDAAANNGHSNVNSSPHSGRSSRRCWPQFSPARMT